MWSSFFKAHIWLQNCRCAPQTTAAIEHPRRGTPDHSWRGLEQYLGVADAGTVATSTFSSNELCGMPTLPRRTGLDPLHYRILFNMQNNGSAERTTAQAYVLATEGSLICPTLQMHIALSEGVLTLPRGKMTMLPYFHIDTDKVSTSGLSLGNECSIRRNVCHLAGDATCVDARARARRVGGQQAAGDFAPRAHSRASCGLCAHRRGRMRTSHAG